MNKLFRVIAAICVICILVAAVPSANAYYERSSDNDLLYGRRQLEGKHLFNTFVVAYDRIVQGIEDRDSSIFLADLFLTADELNLVYTLYKNDPHPHFWVGNGYSYSFSETGSSGICIFAVSIPSLPYNCEI